jgi:hypothetical protein
MGQIKKNISKSYLDKMARIDEEKCFVFGLNHFKQFNAIFEWNQLINLDLNKQLLVK